MMQSRIVILAPLYLLLSLLTWSVHSHAQPANIPADTDPSLNFLVFADGDVRLKRDGWLDYHITTFGTALHRGDRLYPAKGAKAVVLCDDLTTWAVPAGVPAGLTNGCPPPSDPPLMRDKSHIGTTRGWNDPLIPYIISPRKTLLINDKPTLRWNAVPGATGYTIHVRGGGVHWKATARNTAVVYSGEQPLKPGIAYLLIVEADNGRRSEEEGEPGLGFSIINETEAQRVHVGIRRLTELKLPDEARAFALAHLYRSYNLISESVEILDALIGNGSQTAAVYRTLGDLYREIGLNRWAEERYLQALDLSQRENDVEGQALPQKALGLIYYEVFGNKDEAVQRLQEAIDLYQKLGDSKTIEQIRDRLAAFQIQ